MTERGAEQRVSDGRLAKVIAELPTLAPAPNIEQQAIIDALLDLRDCRERLKRAEASLAELSAAASGTLCDINSVIEACMANLHPNDFSVPRLQKAVNAARIVARVVWEGR